MSSTCKCLIGYGTSKNLMIGNYTWRFVNTTFMHIQINMEILRIRGIVFTL